MMNFQLPFLSKENRQVKRLFQQQSTPPIYYYHIRKTGGTSIHYAFLAHSGIVDLDDFYQQIVRKKNQRVIADDKVFVGWNTRLIQGGKYFYGFAHTPAYELQLPKHVFTFTCLRDPIQRVLSHYKMLCYFRDNQVPHSCMLTEGKWLGDSFNDFLKNIPKQHLMNQLYMFSKNYNIEEAEEKIRACSTYFFTENIQEGMADLSEKFNLELKLSHKKKYDYTLNINNEQLARLREMLDKEYRLIERM